MAVKKSTKKPKKKKAAIPKKITPYRVAPTKYASHSDEQKAEALAVLQGNDGDIGKTARDLNISYHTLYFWVRGHNMHPDVLKIQTIKCQELADKVESWCHELLDALPGKLQFSDLETASKAFAIAVDKMRLLRNETTSNTATQVNTSNGPVDMSQPGSWIDDLPLDLRIKLVDEIRKKQAAKQEVIDMPAHVITFNPNLPQDDDE